MRALKNCTAGFIVNLGIIFLVVPVGAQESPVTFQGRLSQEHIFDMDDESFASASLLLSTILSRPLGPGGHLVVSGEAEYDALTDTTGVRFRDAYIDLYVGTVDMRVGRQTINWGTADGLNPAGTLSPLDPSSLTTGIISWEPVNAVSATWFSGLLSVSGAVLFDPGVFRNVELSLPVAVEQPEVKPENFEYALRIESYMSRFDISATYQYVFEDMPAVTGSVDINPGTGEPLPETSSLEGRYRREHRVGGAVTGAVLSFGAWAEAAYVIPEQVRTPDTTLPRVSYVLSGNSERWEVVAGTDYTLPGGVYIQAQYAYYGPGSWLDPYAPSGENHEPTHLVTGRLRYDFRTTNRAELSAIIDVPRETVAISPLLRVGVARATSLELSAFFPFGESTTILGAYPNHVRVALSADF